MDIVFPEKLHDLLQGVIVCAREEGQPGRFCQQAALAVVDPQAKVAYLVDDRVIRRAHQIAIHLARSRQEVVAHHFDRDRI